MPSEEVLLWENPSMLDAPLYNPWYGQSRRHSAAAKKGWRSRRRNPAGALALPAGVRQWTQGVGVEEIMGGGLGLVSASALPAWIVPDVATIGQKWMRVLMGAISTFGVGFVVNAVAGTKAAKASVIGGLAGTAITAINTLTPFRLGKDTGSAVRSVTRMSRSPIRTQTPGFEDIKLY